MNIRLDFGAPAACVIFLSIALLLQNPARAQLGGSSFDGAVNWKVEIAGADATFESGDVVTFKLKGKIRSGLHVFSVIPPKKAANLPTTLELHEASQGVKLQGDLEEEGKAVAEYDDIFETKVRYFEDEVVFVQHFRLTDDRPLISAELKYQVCDEQGMCAAQSHQINYQVDNHGNLVEVQGVELEKED